MAPTEIVRKITEGKYFIITTHVNPDADGVGSCIALEKLLVRLDKKCFIVNHSHLPPSFDFLENITQIHTEVPSEAEVADTWIVVDTSRPERTGSINAGKKRTVLVIDHHADNPGYGDVCWVDGKASATVEMIYQLYREFKLEPDIKAATALYAGLLIDTGGFRFSNTSPRTFTTASALLDAGVLPHVLYRKVFLDKRQARIALEGLMYGSMQLLFDGKVCVMTISRDTLHQAGANDSDLEGLSNYTLSVQNVVLGVLFIEQTNGVKACFRSDGVPDVSEIAALFGGGGHKAASGCTITKSIDNAKQVVLETLAKRF